MDSAFLPVAVLVALATLGVAWLVTTYLLGGVAGTWERVLGDDDDDDGPRAERITLGQFGPLVNGRRDVKGGHQDFSGFVVGRTVTLTRRDYGKLALTSLGFPEHVAEKLEGEVMARMKLTLTDGGATLEGTFEPQKVEFTHQPPRITGMHFLSGQKRKYRRVTPIDARERVPAAIEDVVEPTS